jgi:hypothetical protein
VIPPASQRALAVFATSLVVMGAFWAPAFEHPEATGWGDWQWFHHMWEAGRVAIVRWHEAPLWNPHHCGGVSLWGNPQAQVFSPTYLLLAVPFGTTVGHKLFVLLHAIAGWAGAFVFARRELCLSPLASGLAATLWCGSGFFAWHGAGGHATFLAFYYGPWLLLWWRRAARDLRWSAAVAALMVLIVLEGGHYPFPYFVIWLALDAAFRLFDRRAWKGVLAGALVSGLLTAVLGAMRFVPILLSLTAHPHPVPDTDSLSAAEILEMLTARTHEYRWAGHVWVWPEYGAFVGWTALALAALGLAVALVQLVLERPAWPRREIGFVLIGLVLAFLLIQGNASPLHPWPLLQELPFYRSIHVPSRWRVMLLWHLAILAGFGLDRLRAALARLRAWREARSFAEALPWMIALAACVDLFVVNVPVVDRWDGRPIGRGRVTEHHYLVRGRSYLDEYANYPHENVGTRECYDPVPWDISDALWLGEGPQARLDPEGAGRVRAWGRTSLTMWAEVDVAEPGTIVVFNQNFAPGWSSPQGEVLADDGRLAVELARPGPQRVIVRYRPRDLPYSLAASAVGALACALIGMRRRAIVVGPWRG